MSKGTERQQGPGTDRSGSAGGGRRPNDRSGRWARLDSACDPIVSRGVALGSFEAGLDVGAGRLPFLVVALAGVSEVSGFLPGGGGRLRQLVRHSATLFGLP